MVTSQPDDELKKNHHDIGCGGDGTMMKSHKCVQVNMHAATATTTSYDYDVDHCIEAVTCLTCVKCCFYHCFHGDPDHVKNDDVIWADEPCACAPQGSVTRVCAARWGYLLIAAVVFPLLIFYPILQAMTSLFRRCTRRHQ